MANLSTLIADIKASDKMTDDQLLTLRRATGADMEIDAQEADMLFELNTITKKPEGWTDYFVMVMTTYLVHQGKPIGYVNDSIAAWLIARIDHDGVVETETELRLLMNILKVAEVPGDRLESYALNQVKEAVISGRGHVGQNALTPGIIGQAEVELLRRVFYSVGGKGGMGITRLEAQHIFELNNLTTGRDHHPEWQRFFVGAIANHLMMIAAPEKIDFAEAKRREDWLKDTSLNSGIWASLNASAVISSIKGLFDSSSERDPSRTESVLDDFKVLDSASVQSAERITDDEAQWLVKLMQSDGVTDANERALLEFIRAECPAIDEGLRPWINAA